MANQERLHNPPKNAVIFHSLTFKSWQFITSGRSLYIYFFAQNLKAGWLWDQWVICPERKGRDIRGVICTPASVYIKVRKTMQPHPSPRNHTRLLKRPHFKFSSPSFERVVFLFNANSVCLNDLKDSMCLFFHYIITQTLHCSKKFKVELGAAGLAGNQ